MTHLRSVCGLLVLALSALAQNANLSGLITDPSGAPVQDAEVRLRNNEMGARRVTRSNEEGQFTLTSLPSGSYRIAVIPSDKGLEPAVRERIRLELKQNGRLDVTLQLSPSEPTTIVVHGDAEPAVPTSASVSTTFTRRFIEDLPPSGREIQAMIGLTPGAVITPVSYYSLGQFSVNGQRPNANHFTIDGGSVNFGITFKGHYPNILNVGQQAIGSGPSQAISGSVPATSIFGGFNSLAAIGDIQEFRILTSSMSPEYGHTPGAQVALVTRSGTKRFSGSVYEHMRHDALNADDWFAFKYRMGTPRVRYHNFGGSVGGPLRLRPSNGEVRTFFYSSLESVYLLRPGAPFTETVPSVEKRRSASAPARALLQAWPLPTGVASASAYNAGEPIVTGNYSRPSSLWTYAARLDHSFKTRGSIFARLSTSASHASDYAHNYNPANSAVNSVLTQLSVIGWNQVVGKVFLNEMRLSAGRQNTREAFRIDTFGGALRPPEYLLFPSGVSSADSLVSYGNATVGSAAANSARQIQVLDTATLNIGRHVLKLGVDYRWFSPVIAGPRLEIRADYGLSEEEEQVNMVTVIARPRTAMLTPSLSLFVQDAWQLLPRLTMTFGLRWEINPALRSKGSSKLLTVAGFSGVHDLSTLSPVETRDPLYSTRYSNFAPRLGVAVRLAQHKRGQTMARAGGGVFYDLGYDGFGNMTPLPLWISRHTRASLPLSASIALPPRDNRFQDNLYSASIAILPMPGFDLPKTYQWSIAIQHSYLENLFSATYVGARGRGLVGQGMLRSGGSTNMVIVGNIGSSVYNSLQLQFTRTHTKGVQAVVSYSWAHSIDDVANVVGNLQLNQWSNSLINPLSEFLNPKVNRGDSDFDIRHSISGAVSWHLGRSAGASIIKRFRHGWTVDAIGFARTPPPSNVLAPLGPAAAKYATPPPDRRRPDLVPGQPLYIYGDSYPGGKWLNKDAFAIPKGSQGTLGRNALRLFGAWQTDVAIHREFRIAQKSFVQFRADIVNIFNHPSYANPTDLESRAPSGYTYVITPPGTASESLANGLSSIPHRGLDPLFQVGAPRSCQLTIRISF